MDPFVRAVLFNALRSGLRHPGYYLGASLGLSGRTGSGVSTHVAERFSQNASSRGCRDRKSAADAVGAAPIRRAFRVCSRAAGWRRRFGETDPFPARMGDRRRQYFEDHPENTGDLVGFPEAARSSAAPSDALREDGKQQSERRVAEDNLAADDNLARDIRRLHIAET